MEHKVIKRNIKKYVPNNEELIEATFDFHLYYKMRQSIQLYIINKLNDNHCKDFDSIEKIINDSFRGRLYRSIRDYIEESICNNESEVLYLDFIKFI